MILGCDKMIKSKKVVLLTIGIILILCAIGCAFLMVNCIKKINYYNVNKEELYYKECKILRFEEKHAVKSGCYFEIIVEELDGMTQLRNEVKEMLETIREENEVKNNEFNTQLLEILNEMKQYQGDNGVIQTPVKLPIPELKQMRRLVADEGKILVNGDERTSCIDVDIDKIELWQEVDIKDEQL